MLASHQVVRHNFMNFGRNISLLHQRSTLTLAVASISVAEGKMGPHPELAVFQEGHPEVFSQMVSVYSAVWRGDTPSRAKQVCPL